MRMGEKSVRALAMKSVEFPVWSISVNGKNNEDKDYYKKLVVFGYWQLLADGDVVKFTLKDLREKCFRGRVSFATIKRVVQELIREQCVGNYKFKVKYDGNERYLKEDEPILLHGIELVKAKGKCRWVHLRGSEFLKIIQFNGRSGRSGRSEEEVLAQRYECGKLLYVYLYAKLKMLYNRKRDGERKTENGYKSIYVPLLMSLECFGKNVGLSRSSVNKYLKTLVDDLGMLVKFNLGYYKGANGETQQTSTVYCLKGAIGQMNMVPKYMYMDARERGFWITDKRAEAINEWIKANGGTVLIKPNLRRKGKKAGSGDDGISSDWNSDGTGSNGNGSGYKLNNNSSNAKNYMDINDEQTKLNLSVAV